MDYRKCLLNSVNLTSSVLFGEMGYIQQWVERWDIYSNEWRDGIYTAMSGEIGYIQQWVERWDIYSHEWKRSKNGRMEQSEAVECGRRKASPGILKTRNIYMYIYTFLYGQGPVRFTRLWKGSKARKCRTSALR
jgi:hypothetical protein